MKVLSFDSLDVSSVHFAWHTEQIEGNFNFHNKILSSKPLFELHIKFVALALAHSNTYLPLSLSLSLDAPHLMRPLGMKLVREDTQVVNDMKNGLKY